MMAVKIVTAALCVAAWWMGLETTARMVAARMDRQWRRLEAGDDAPAPREEGKEVES